MLVLGDLLPAVFLPSSGKAGGAGSVRPLFCGRCQLGPGLMFRSRRGWRAGRWEPPAQPPPLPTTGVLSPCLPASGLDRWGLAAGGWEAGAGTETEPRGLRLRFPPGKSTRSVAAGSRQPGMWLVSDVPLLSLCWALCWRRGCEAGLASRALVLGPVSARFPAPTRHA